MCNSQFLMCQIIFSNFLSCQILHFLCDCDCSVGRSIHSDYNFGKIHVMLSLLSYVTLVYYNKHKLVHISCEVKFSQSTWAFICNYLTRYLPQYKKDGAGTKSFCKGKIKLMLKDLKNCEPPWWMSNLAEWLEHWCMLVKHPGARVRIHLMGHNYFPHSAYSQTELSSTLLQPKKL